MIDRRHVGTAFSGRGIGREIALKLASGARGSSSTSGVSGNAGQASCAAAKASINGFTGQVLVCGRGRP